MYLGWPLKSSPLKWPFHVSVTIPVFLTNGKRFKISLLRNTISKRVGFTKQSTSSVADPYRGARRRCRAHYQPDITLNAGEASDLPKVAHHDLTAQTSFWSQPCPAIVYFPVALYLQITLGDFRMTERNNTMCLVYVSQNYFVCWCVY